MKKSATLSADGLYRYTLQRCWDEDKPRVFFICLNPSTADAEDDDKTVRRIIGFARDWGFGGVLIGNLFALRSRDPSALYKSADPVGPDNDMYLRQMAEQSELIVAAWGNHGRYLKRSDVVRKMFPMKCLYVNCTGEPRHPLYVTEDEQLKDYA